jgi:hypothetical protein
MVGLNRDKKVVGVFEVPCVFVPLHLEREKTFTQISNEKKLN